ncbi:MAG: dephospho-CoA kinase [Planctomycetota bacterium]|jgi:dephospho-CoA kinase
MNTRKNPGGRSEGIPVIGLVGGVCSGKSTAGGEFAALGCTLIDGDAIGHEVLGDPQVRELLERRWGGRILDADGSVDREMLGRIVFEDADELAALDEITAPLIRRRIEERIAERRRRKDVPAIVLDAAILFEAGWDKLCTHVLFVAADDAQRMRRAAERGWDAEQWRNREKSQIALDTKADNCYAVLDNSSSVSHLREQIREILRRIVHEADRP